MDHQRTGSVDRLNEAVARLREVIDILPGGHGDVVGYTTNLATVLLERYERFGARDDLFEAATAARRALEWSSPTAESLTCRVLGSVLVWCAQLSVVDGAA